MPRIRAASIDLHKEQTRRALLHAAQSLIADAGTAEVPLGEIALAAGVGRTTFYDYFDDRDDVIASLVEEELPGVIADLIAQVPRDLNSERRLAALAALTVNFVATDRVLGVILHQEAGRMGVEAQTRVRESHTQLSLEMANIYVSGVADGVFRAMPPYLAGRFIQDTIMSAAKVLIEDPSRAEVVTTELERFLLGGLAEPSRGRD